MRLIRALSKEQCERVARETLKLDSDVQIAAFLRDLARCMAPACFEDVERE